MGININGNKIVIFKNEKGQYSTSISNKKEDGSYENMYITVNMPRGVEVENKTRIEITKGFLSFYKTKEGLPKLKIVVQKFKTQEDIDNAEEQYAKEEREAIQNEDTYEDLPF